MTTLICEKCGKIYHLDPEKLKARISGEEARVRCRECGHVMRISKKLPNVAAPQPLEIDESRKETIGPSVDIFRRPPENAEEGDGKKSQKDSVRDELPAIKGLRTKMAFFFFILPLLFLAALGLGALWQMDVLFKTFSGESASIVTSMAEDNAADMSREVAKRVAAYLGTHPELEPPDFNYDSDFRDIVIRRIGKSGYTALGQRPLQHDTDSSFRIRVHPDANVIASPAPMAAMLQQVDEAKRKLLLAQIMTGDSDVRFKYLWKERDKDAIEKSAIIVPVKGTDFFIFSSINDEDFLDPVSRLETKAGNLVKETQLGAMVIAGAACFLLALIVLVFGHSLSKKIRILKEAASKTGKEE